MHRWNVAQLVRLPNKTQRSWVQPATLHRVIVSMTRTRDTRTPSDAGRILPYRSIPSASKGIEGDLFITYVVVDNASARYFLGSLACASILRTLSIMVRFILSASPFSSGVFGTVNSSRIPFEQQYSSNCPRYSPPLSVRTAFSFWPDSLSTLAWSSLKTDNT